jgi:hypothetical protein
MLTPLTTKDEDESKISSEYYSTHYTPQHHHYYYHPPVSFNDDSNNHHHSQTSNLYDPTQYYTLSPPGYSHPQTNTRINEDDSNNPISSSIYMPIYHPHHPHNHRHHYSPDEILFPQKPTDQQSTPIYDYNLSPIPSNQIFHQHQNYIQTPVEQTACSTSNGGEYLTPYVSTRFYLTGWSLRRLISPFRKSFSPSRKKKSTELI